MNMALLFTTFCFVFASVVFSGGEGRNPGESTAATQEPIGNTSFSATPALSDDSDGVLPTLGVGEAVGDPGAMGGNPDVVSTTPSPMSSPTDARTTTPVNVASVVDARTTTPVNVASVVDAVTTVTASASVDIDSNDDMSTNSATDASSTVTPGSDSTTYTDTTQHVNDETPINAATSPASMVQTKVKVNTMTTPTADDTTQTYDDKPNGATVQTLALVTNIDEPVATESVALDDTDKDARTRILEHLGGALMPVYDMTSFFLERIVQPHYVTQLNINLTDVDGGLQQAADGGWSTWTVYFIGFVVCASAGVVLSIVTPCVGLCIACCRCAGHCGSKIDPSDGRRAKCQRIGCGLALLVITAALVVAVVSVFALNERLRQQLRAEDTSSFDDVSRSIGDVESYLNGTTAEIQAEVIDRCSDHIDGLTAQAARLPDRFIEALDNATGVQTALTELRQVNGGLQKFTSDVAVADKEATNLQNQTKQLQTRLFAVKAELIHDLANCSTKACNTTRDRVLRLNVTSNFSEISLHGFLVLLENANLGGVYDVTHIAVDEIEGIRTSVNASIAPYLAEYRNKADNVRTLLRTAVHNMTTYVDKLKLTDATKVVHHAKDLVQWPAHIVYCCLASLALVVCIIVLCNIIGVLYGTFSRRATLTSDGPCDTDRSVGANWLLAGVGFTFTFYLLLTLATMALFLGGGLTHTEVCRHLVNYDNSRQSAEVVRFLETSVLQSLGVRPNAVNATSVYDRCRRNESFYAAAALETTPGFNISQFIDLQTVRQLADDVKDVSLIVPTIALLPPVPETLLRTPQYISETCDQLSADIITEDLVQLSDYVEALANSPDLGENITANANKLRDIADKVTAIRNATGRLVTVLRTADGFINTSVNIFGKLNKSLEAMNTHGNASALAFINLTADAVYVDIQALRADLERRLRHDIGRCRPVYVAVSTVIDTTCIKLLYPVNAVWFCLGCCIFLLLPSVILSFKLVTLYRKLDPFDESPYEYADPIYDAYRPSDYHDYGDQPREMLIQKLDTTRPRSYEPLGPVDNPVYMMDSEVELTGPPDNNRPRFFSPGYPVYAKPVVNRAVDPGRPSPPPSYESSTGAESSYDTRL